MLLCEKNGEEGNIMDINLICKYAKKQGNTFSCEAPSDGDMPCNK